MSLDASAIVERERGAESSRLGREVVVLDPAGTMLRGLNATGGRIWELIDGRRSLEQIAAALSAELNIEASRLLGDVIAFVDALVARKLVRPVAGGGT